MKEVSVYGAKTLRRYTKDILVSGLRKNGLEANEVPLNTVSDTDMVLLQLHGAPQADADDKAILKQIQNVLQRDDSTKVVVLLHRPDELQKFSDIRDIVLSYRKKFGLVFFGDKYTRDPFYSTNAWVTKKIIPHGFFPMEPFQKILQTDPVVIGTHTTWGEMRSVEHALRLLSEIFHLAGNNENIVGYLGGKPADALRIDSLAKSYQSIDPQGQTAFLDVHAYPDLHEAIKKNKGNNVVLIDNEDKQPTYFSVTFNIQLYYFGDKVRLGESSGSAHTAVSIPVVLEMNGAEVVEDIRVIKIPYNNVNDISRIDFTHGAQAMIRSIRNGSYKDMLRHNAQQAEIWNNARIGKEYVQLFNEL